MNTKTSTNDALAAVQIVTAIADVIKTLGSVPNGHLYARVMDKMSIQTYESIIDLLKRSNLVEEKHHVLHWIG